MSEEIKKLTTQDGESKDLVAENVEKLKKLFPEIVTEGKIDFETLEELLGQFTDKSNERYSFTWNGKSKARKLAMTPSRGTLRPAPEESVNWDATENLFIEGDNLEVLKLLQRSYHKKVKMIYIDPPYNTGKDFVYPDDYKDTIGNYLKLTEQLDGDGKKVSTNPEYSGRYHTDWLNMMYPRLKLSWELLRDDGVIFISIDENEHFNLKNMCNEVFGDDNFVVDIVWEKKFSPQNDAKYFSHNHEYIVCYAKNKEQFSRNLLPLTEQQKSRYKNPDNDERGDWTSSDLTVARYTTKDVYEVQTPSGETYLPPDGRSWGVSKDKFEELRNDNRIWFGSNNDNMPRLKRFISEINPGKVPISIFYHKDVGHTQSATQDLKDLFDGKKFFDYPKPVNLIKKLIHIGTNNSDIILDFFAGSSTTAHATFLKNRESSSNNKFIMVQLPEKLDETSEAYKAGYKTISMLAVDRIKRVAKKINTKYPNYSGDLGFKVFKLDTSNIKPWDPSFDNVQLSLEDSIENVKAGRTELDVLYEILLKYGLDLTLPIEERTVGNAKVYVAGAGALILCLSDQIGLDVVEGIAKIKDELQPELIRVVFRDGGFKDDVVKTNAVQILKQHGIEDVRSI